MITAVSTIAWLLSFLYILTFSNCEGSIISRTLFISPNGADTLSCGKRNEPCRSLDHVYSMSLSSGFNSTRLSLGKGKYKLRKSLTFIRVKDFCIAGDEEEKTTGPNEVEISCEADAGIAFFLSQNITLRGLRLLNCGSWQENAVLFPNATVLKFKTAINFDYCRDIRMQNVDISRSIGSAAHLNEIGGLLEMSNCRFVNNSANMYAWIANSTSRREKNEQGQQQDALYLVSGGGVVVSLNKYSRHRPSFMSVTREEHSTYVRGNKYFFTDCSFLRNEVSSEDRFPDYFNETFYHPFTEGGGLGIHFHGVSSNSTVLVSNCTFSDNKAPWGGGLVAEFTDHSSENCLLVENCLFERNVGYTAGGGARLGVMLPRGVSVPMNEVRFVNATFRHNSGRWGGGVSLYGTSVFVQCRHHLDSRSTFIFQSCHWIENHATIGAAIGAFLFNQNADHIGPEVPVHAEFKSCTVTHNRVDTQEPNVRIGEGTIYSFGISLIFRGKMIITNNTLTALALDGSTLELHDDVEFVENEGFHGGAVAMYGHSKILLWKNSSVLCRNNSCRDKGGAMFVSAPGSPQISYNVTGKDPQSCFFAYEDHSTSGFDNWEAQVVFEDNRAPDDSSGNSVFATTLERCLEAGETRVKNKALHWNFVKYITNNNALQNHTRVEIATDPVDIFFDVKDWIVSPSQVFNPVVRLVDEKNNNVSGVVNVKLEGFTNDEGDDASSVHLQTPSSLFLADGNVSRLTLAGEVGRGFSVVLHHVGRQVLQKEINVSSGLRTCHPGFILRRGSCVCQQQSEGVSRCDGDGKTVFLKRGFWAGMVNGNFVTYRCPKNYCNCSRTRETIAAEDECVFDAEKLCVGNREPGSILCGKCKQGFSVVGGDTKCYECGKYDFIGSTVLDLVFILVLVMLIMFFDIDAFTGSLSAFLYSYQVIWQVTGDGFTFRDPVMRFILHAANFEVYVGTHYCYWDGMDYADKLFMAMCFDFLTILIVIKLTKLVTQYPNCWFSRRVKAPFRAVCTICVICYTRITYCCLSILHPAVIGDTTVLYVSGDTEFFRGKHAVYGSIALLFTALFVVLFPLVLMFRPFFRRCLKPVFNLNHLKPIFDVLQSTFKDQYRFFAAFYFVCRLILLVIGTYVPEGPLKRSLIEVACVVILSIFAFLKPYKRSEDVEEGRSSFSWVNKSDALLLLNLAVMAVFSSATTNYDISKDSRMSLIVLIHILAYVPFVALFSHLYRKVKGQQCWSEWCDYEEKEELPPVTDTVAYTCAEGNETVRVSRCSSDTED